MCASDAVRLVILDRDGVINYDSRDFVQSSDEWRALPGSLAAIAALSRNGYTVAIASNQSGLARGLFDRRDLRNMHRKLRRGVAAAGGRVDRIVVCPHGPDDGCDCRKPAPGLLRRLAAHYKTTLDHVPYIGDAGRDLEAALAAGAQPILVRTGKGRQTEQTLTAALATTPVFDDLAAFTDAWLARELPFQ